MAGLTFGILNLASCATLVEGPANEYQKTKPAPGEPQRDVRVGYLLLDFVLFGPIGVAVDFATGNIYKKDASSGYLVKSREEKRIAHERRRAYLLAERELKRIRKAEGPEGLSYEQAQKVDSLIAVMQSNKNPR
jgi:hypothetical protein